MKKKKKEEKKRKRKEKKRKEKKRIQGSNSSRIHLVARKIINFTQIIY